MTKEDIAYLAAKLLGLYLTITHLVSFIVSSISLIWLIQQSGESFARQAFYMWQAPVSSFLVLLLGFILLMKTRRVCSLIFKDNTAEQGAAANP